MPVKRRAAHPHRRRLLYGLVDNLLLHRMQVGTLPGTEANGDLRIGREAIRIFGVADQRSEFFFFGQRQLIVTAAFDHNDLGDLRLACTGRRG